MSKTPQIIDAEFEVIHGPSVNESRYSEPREYVELYPELRLTGWRLWMSEAIGVSVGVAFLVAWIAVSLWITDQFSLSDALHRLADIIPG